MNKQQAGFTLIELVMVIVILGILAATAIPKYVDMRADAQRAAVQGVASGLSAASAINYAGCSLTGNVVTAGKCAQVAACADVGALMSPPMTLGTTASTTNYYLAANTASTTNGTAVTCTLQIDEGSTSPAYTATFSAIGAAN